MDTDIPPRDSVIFDPEFFHPSIESITQVRNLLMRAVRDTDDFAAKRGYLSEDDQEKYARLIYPDVHRFRRAEEGEIGEMQASEHDLLDSIFKKPLEDDPLSVIRKLETPEEWMAYFDEFDTPENIAQGKRPVLGKIFLNLGFIEITDGCDGPCRSTCALDSLTKVKGHIPYEVLEFIFRQFSAELNISNPSLYYASDIKYYQVTDSSGNTRTGADVVSLYQEHVKNSSYVSSAFGLDNKFSVEFVYQMMVRNLPIHRLSRLVTGRKPGDFDKFIDKLLKLNGEKGGPGFQPHQLKMLEVAFGEGGKEGMDTTLGNAIHDSTPEEDISTAQIACKTGINLTKNGFEVMVLMPPSKCFPYQSLKFPLVKEADESLVIPHLRYVNDHKIRSDSFISQPEWITIMPDGVINERFTKELALRNQSYRFESFCLRWDIYRIRKGIKSFSPENSDCLELTEILADIKCLLANQVVEFDTSQKDSPSQEHPLTTCKRIIIGLLPEIKEKYELWLKTTHSQESSRYERIADFNERYNEVQIALKN